jgi:Fur family ferric uptake transcriptional regulator
MSNKIKSLAKSRKALSGSGLKVTAQRALVLEVIRRGKGHLDADEVYRRAREEQPRLSLSTVYRALQRFKESGLITECHFDESHHHYEIKPSSEHHHLVCLGCGRVVEFQCPLMAFSAGERDVESQCPLTSLVVERVGEAKGFEIVDTELRMTGYCPECLRKTE